MIELAQAAGPSSLPEILGLGGCVAGLLWFAYHQLASHREERKEWRESTQKQFEKFDEREEKRCDREDKRCDRTEAAFEKWTDAIRDSLNK